MFVCDPIGPTLLGHPAKVSQKPVTARQHTGQTTAQAVPKPVRESEVLATQPVAWSNIQSQTTRRCGVRQSPEISMDF